MLRCVKAGAVVKVAARVEQEHFKLDPGKLRGKVYSEIKRVFGWTDDEVTRVVDWLYNHPIP
jgi:hypothetical protein